MQPLSFTVAHPRPVRSFAEALFTVVDLQDRAEFGHGVAVLGGNGRVHNLTVFTDRHRHTIETALEWAGATVATDLQADAFLLFSIGIDDLFGAPAVATADRALYRRWTGVLGDCGLRLLDWLRTDGDFVESLAFALEPTSAWTGFPVLRTEPALRLLRGGPAEGLP